MTTSHSLTQQLGDFIRKWGTKSPVRDDDYPLSFLEFSQLSTYLLEQLMDFSRRPIASQDANLQQPTHIDAASILHAARHYGSCKRLMSSQGEKYLRVPPETAGRVLAGPGVQVILKPFLAFRGLRAYPR